VLRRIAALAAALAVSCGVIVAIAAAPAHASTPGARSRCLNRLADDAHAQVTVPGLVSYGGFFGSAGTWGPNGNGKLAPISGYYPFPGGPQYALVGTWNHTGSDVRIGSVSACLVVPPGGDGVSIPWGLWLIPNDDNRSDNGGAYVATVHVWRASLSP
jgi:hypothetical protein